MDSITHALYRAIRTEEARAREKLGAGLRPFRSCPAEHQTYAGAAESDLYGLINPSEELTAVWMEFTAAGMKAPVSMITYGCEVILFPGGISVCVQEDNAEPGVWCATLGPIKGRTGWDEQIC